MKKGDTVYYKDKLVTIDSFKTGNEYGDLWTTIIYPEYGPTCKIIVKRCDLLSTPEYLSQKREEKIYELFYE
jgi:hypothetical protein